MSEHAPRNAASTSGEPTEDELLDLAEEVLRRDGLDWDRNRGLIFERARQLWAARHRSDAASTSVAALFVYPDGIYADVPGVEIWDEARDARLYDGPHPVVAHPPCKAWSLMSNCRPEIVKDEDGGGFEAALRSVRTYGGVLEHPAHTRAWKRYGLPHPPTLGWQHALWGEGWACEVDQRWYGHEANKPTWLYYVGDALPPDLQWGRAPAGEKTVGRSWGQGRDRHRSGTPPRFRDLLIATARGARQGAWLPRAVVT